MKVGYRSDLKMPRGKVIAQCSHAVSSLILGCFDFELKKFKTDPALLIKLIESMNLEPLTDCEFNKKKFLIEIVDEGRTVFKGEKTKTCGLELTLELKNQLNYAPNEYDCEKPKEVWPSTRLLQVVNKDFARSNFEKAMRDCIIGQNLYLVENMQKTNFVERPEFIYWAKGSFAKIVLITNSEGLESLAEKINKSYSKYVPGCFYVCGPIFKDDKEVLGLTSGLKMM